MDSMHVGGGALDGHRLEAVAAQRDLPEVLRLIVAAGGKPASLAKLTKPAAAEALRALGFTKAPLRTRLLAALFAHQAETDGPAPSTSSQPTSTIVLKHKVQNGARELKLATAPARADLEFARDGVAFVTLPPALLSRLSALRTLAHANEAAVDLEAFGSARAALEAWLNAWLPSASHAAAQGDESQPPPPPPHHYLRHCIVRDTHPAEGAAARKTLPLQKPGKAFHIDSDHTDLVSVWLPLEDEPLSDHQLGFLSVAQGLKWGEAVVFRSGGSSAVVHGSFRFDGDRRTDAPRRSVEFRCQPRDDGLGFSPVAAAEEEQTVVVIAGTELS